MRTTQLSTPKTENRLGKCFELSGIFVMKNPEWNLVHGVIKDNIYGTASSIVHAWCEKEDAAFDYVLNKDDKLVYDPVLDEELPARAYYSLYGIISHHFNDYERRHKVPETTLVRYSGEEALRHIEDTLTYGPWDEFIINHKDTIGK